MNADLIKDMIFDTLQVEPPLNFDYIQDDNHAGFTVERGVDHVTIYFSSKSYLTMAIGYVASNLDKCNYRHSQALEIERMGIMIDCARNAVPSLIGLKRFILNAAVTGYNFLQLYVEDCMEVDDEPYFGYMRGRYSKSEIKEIDSFCTQLGVELVPCIQTLSHLDNIFRHDEYRAINDIHDILMLNEERTYVLVENIFRTVRECFSSNNINIGMDEAFYLGLGKYMIKYGYKDKRLLLREHLAKVLELCNKYDFRPSMWTDMFFRLLLDSDYYDDKRTLEVMPREIVEIVPQGVDLIYWDYYHTNQEDYEHMLRLHKQLGNNIQFAGGAWRWQGFAPYNQFTMDTFSPAIAACKNFGVKTVMLTAWGDNGAECSYNALLGAYLKSASQFYTNKETIDVDIDRTAVLLTGYNLKELFELDLPNYITKSTQPSRPNPCKYLLYDDVLIGAYSYRADEHTAGYYKGYARKLKRLAKRKTTYSYLFDTMGNLCAALELKADLAIRVRQAYKTDNKEELLKLAQKVIPVAVERIKRFYQTFCEQWNRDNKPFGFEIQDARLGGVIHRLKHVKKRIVQYLDLGTPIEELEQTFLPVSEDIPEIVIRYNQMISLCQN